jgi:hypothetical protein
MRAFVHGFPMKTPRERCALEERGRDGGEREGGRGFWEMMCNRGTRRIETPCSTRISFQEDRRGRMNTRDSSKSPTPSPPRSHHSPPPQPALTSILPAHLLSPRKLQWQCYTRDNDTLEHRGDITGPHPAACWARQTCSRREVRAKGGVTAHHPYLREFREGKGRQAPLDHNL